MGQQFHRRLGPRPDLMLDSPFLATAGDPLPWVNINQIIVQFDSVPTNLLASDFSLTGVATENYSFTFEFDTETLQAVLTLPAAIESDKLRLLIGTGLAIDEAAVFEFNVLPGDANQNQSVFGDDLDLVRPNQFSFAGSPTYPIFQDVNANGSIFGDDLDLIRPLQFSFLPFGDLPPLAPPPAAAVSSSLASSEAASFASNEAAALVTTENLDAASLAPASVDRIWGDTNGDGRLSALDALRVINQLATTDPEGEQTQLADNTQWLDVSGDGRVTAIDALQIINRLTSEDDAFAAISPMDDDADPISESLIDEVLSSGVLF